MTPPSDEPTPEVEKEEEGKMSFFEHLVDLRKRLINSAIAIAIGTMVGVTVAQKVMGFIVRPMQAALRRYHQPDTLIFTGPAGLINLIITFGLYLGVVIAAPYVLYQVWLFIAPGLYKHERKAVTGFIFFSFFLFPGGDFFWLLRHAAVHAGFPDRISRPVPASDQHQ